MKIEVLKYLQDLEEVHLMEIIVNIIDIQILVLHIKIQVLVIHKTINNTLNKVLEHQIIINILNLDILTIQTQDIQII